MFPLPSASAFRHVQVLEQLLEENDEDPNVWLLMALCCQGGGDLEGALEAGKARRCWNRRCHASLAWD